MVNQNNKRWSFSNNIENIFDEVDAIVIMTEWVEFQKFKLV